MHEKINNIFFFQSQTVVFYHLRLIKIYSINVIFHNRVGLPVFKFVLDPWKNPLTYSVDGMFRTLLSLGLSNLGLQFIFANTR